jgi:hypothetical protein
MSNLGESDFVGSLLQVFLCTISRGFLAMMSECEEG